MLHDLTEKESQDMIQHIIRYAGFDLFDFYVDENYGNIYLNLFLSKNSCPNCPVIVSNDSYGSFYNIFKVKCNWNYDEIGKYMLNTMLEKVQYGNWILGINTANHNERHIIISPYETIDSFRIKMDLMRGIR